ncbi:MAG TPA: efflux RND transporter permease subunit [Candidatus Baltobacteraceae bacterium]|nr:efflux RND transporter permease subunit [Candidatus Baltobacteraceae bacterium]
MPVAKFAVHRRVAVSMIALAIVVLGIFAIPRLPIALLPNFTQPVVTVTVTYPNVGPEQMETLITRPIENAVSRVNGIQQIKSSSSEGTSQVQAQFYFGTNIDTAAVDVQEQVSRIWGTLPNDPNLQQPVITKFDSNSLPVVRVYITDPNMSLRDLGDLFTNQLADQFSAIDGVAAVTVNNDQQRAIMVQPDAKALAANGITLQQIMQRISQENINLPAGIVQVGNNEYLVRASALLKSAQETGNLVVTTKNGAPIRLNQVASVTDSILEQRTFQRLNGTPALGMVINAQPSANMVSTALGVYAKIRQIEQRYPGMNISVVFDQQGFITEAIDALEHTAIYGALLAIAIIFLFLHSWRSTLIVAISLPVSVLGTLFAAYVFGYSLNVMTLGGLALAVGLIVDDAIVVIENIYRHLARGQTPIQAAEAATSEIFSAVLASSVTVITVFVPLVLIPGLQGLLFTPFAVMVMCAVGLSLVVALTQVPMLASVILHHRPALHGNGAANEEDKSAYARFSAAFDDRYERFAQWYARLLARAVDRPRFVFGVALAVLVVTLIAVRLGAVQTELFPPSNSLYPRFNLQMPTGTAVSITNAVSADVENRLLRDPRVLAVGTQVGQQGYISGTIATNRANLSVTLKPGTSSAQAQQFVMQWTSALTGSRFSGRGRGANTISPAQLARIRARFGAPIPGLKVFGRTIDIMQNIIARGQDALQIQIFGPDVTKLYNIAEFTAIPKLQSEIAGLQPPQPGITDAQPEIDVNVNRTLAAQLGVDTQTISQAIDIGTAGATASYMQINGTQYPIEVQLPPDQRRTLQTIASLAIPVASVPTGLVVNSASSGGTQIASVNGSVQVSGTNNFTLQTMPLSELASITFGNGPSEITRQDKQREIDIDAGLNIPLGQAVAQATKVMNSIALPAGYHWAFGPQVQQQGQTFASLGLIVALAILLVYMLLASQFESVLHPLVIMVAVPLASAGIVFGIVARNLMWSSAAAITHQPFTPMAFGLTAFIGVLMLVGIAVKNAILVVEFTNQLRERGMSARDAVLHAAPLRLRPILMTTAATVGGMTPIAMGLEAGSQTQAPLGTVVIGGLLVSTTLSLIVVPTLYLWVARHVEPRMGGFHRAVVPTRVPGADLKEAPISAIE